MLTDIESQESRGTRDGEALREIINLGSPTNSISCIELMRIYIGEFQRRLKSVKDRLREMTLWFEQVMLEDDDERVWDNVPEN
ncbi:hypothetical protein RchiOBHm_Chr4g0393081 [Rosa chinensis]|uniref:Uncharacterized protein n=1 Tax=Rosa chinensis TaxID=74649 RepID=A0A2P6QQX4_ROSCH|nr:hypothetical protein RchiOBHm_Chr4g0393081 [Rosa chinensis]